MAETDGLRINFPVAYRGFALNSIRNTDGTLKHPSAHGGTFTKVTRFDFSRLQQRDQREALHVLSGGDLGVATNVFRYISIVGELAGANAAALDDLEALHHEALDVENAQREVPATEGISGLTFRSSTAQAGMSPIVDERFKCRPASYPAVYDRQNAGLTKLYAVELICADPRRYKDPSEVWSAFPANSWSVVLRNYGTVPGVGPGVATWPIVTVDTVPGAYSAAFTINVGNGIPFVMDLSGITSGNNQVVVDMFRQSITLGGVRRDDLRTSDVRSFFPITRGGVTAVVTNHGNIDTVDFDYRQARA